MVKKDLKNKKKNKVKKLIEDEKINEGVVEGGETDKKEGKSKFTKKQIQNKLIIITIKSLKN